MGNKEREKTERGPIHYLDDVRIPSLLRQPTSSRLPVHGSYAGNRSQFHLFFSPSFALGTACFQSHVTQRSRNGILASPVACWPYNSSWRNPGIQRVCSSLKTNNRRQGGTHRHQEILANYKSAGRFRSWYARIMSRARKQRQYEYL